MRPSDSNRAATRWSIRLTPLFIAAILGITTYTVPYRVCVRYLYRARGKTGLTAAFLVLYFVFFLLALACYLRTLLVIQLDPGLVPLVDGRDDHDVERHATKGRGRDPEVNPWVPPDQNPDSPGLEAFYSKDVFLCEPDGRPKWCADCRQWKPDRAHHSSDLDRCVRKMDHLCPWVGGMVSETSLNFFFQFTSYIACLCVICIGACAYCLQQQRTRGTGVDGWFIAVVVLASVFGLFTIAMSMTSARLVFTNFTSIDILKRSQNLFLAVHIPRNSPTTDAFPTVVYPLQRPPSRHASDASRSRSGSDPDEASTRDQRATRKFAILRTEPNENPWDLGFWRNWKSVMGNHVVEWLLPIRQSPCCNHESMESDYQMGPLISVLKARYGLPELDGDVSGGVEMRDTTMLAP